MDKNFVPYEEALALRELGFDEICFNWYQSFNHYKKLEGGKSKNTEFWLKYPNCSAPLYQQAFDWIRETYNLGHFIKLDNIEERIYFGWIDKAIERDAFEHVGKGTYEEMRLACLKKLIEIVQYNESKKG